MLRKFRLDSARLRRVQKKGVVARRVRAFWWTFSHKAETHRAVLVRSRRSRLNCGRLITNKIEYDNVNDIRHTTIRAPYELLGPRSTKGRRYEGTSHSQGAHSVVIRDGCVNPSAAYAGLLACGLLEVSASMRRPARNGAAAGTPLLTPPVLRRGSLGERTDRVVFASSETTFARVRVCHLLSLKSMRAPLPLAP